MTTPADVLRVIGDGADLALLRGGESGELVHDWLRAEAGLLGHVAPARTRIALAVAELIVEDPA